MKVMLIMIFFIAVLGIKPIERRVIEPEDLVFTHCTCDGAVYCLSDEEYGRVIAALSQR